MGNKQVNTLQEKSSETDITYTRELPLNQLIANNHKESTTGCNKNSTTRAFAVTVFVQQ